MKNYIGLIILILLPFISFSQKKGYDIKIQFTEDVGDKQIYLCKYYAKGISEVFKVDSAIVDKNGTFHFKKNEELLGGMYLILYKNRTRWYDIVMYNGLKVEFIIDPNDVTKTKIKGSKENILNHKYLVLAEEYGEKSQNIRKELESAKTHEDSVKVFEKIEQNRNEFVEKRDIIVEEGKNTLFAKIIKAIDKPIPPKGTHYKEDGTVDTFYGFYYVKNNFWNNFDFTEERLIHTPILDAKLKDYFDNYVIPKPDTFQNEADILLAYARLSPELFKYTLHFITNYARTSKYMGMDESFVYLVNKYYRAGDAVWLDSTSLHKNYLSVADEWDKTKLGKIAPNLKMRDAYDFHHVELEKIEADYTIVVFWETGCGICLKEVPAIDSIYQALNLKDKNVQIFSIPSPSDKKLETIHKTVEKLNIHKDYWNHVIDVDNTARASQLYGVASTPQIFILDKNKKIIGKNIKHDGISKVIEIDEMNNNKK